MKFEDLLKEGIIKQGHTTQHGRQREFGSNLLLSFLQQGNIDFQIPFTKIDTAHYIAKMYGREDLFPLIETAAMDPDFQKRDKAQKQLPAKFAPLFKQLRQDLYKICSERGYPKVSKNNQGDFVVEYRNEPGSDVPYIKFVNDKRKRKWYLISFHDSEFALKKKSYQDNSSYKFGSRDVRDRIRAGNN